ncbi:hypothetical protein FKP32DRAFT_917164 [Trametes sanguinea]|nr:hypothetical protein FKP32DRAFT_917164 [Trametes sanguinea]
MLPEEWTQMARYAVYVRTLYNRLAAPLSSKHISSDSWRIIRRDFTDRPILPNLRVLDWTAGEANTDFAALVAFLSPSLKDLTIDCAVGAVRNGTPSGLEEGWIAQMTNLVSELSKRVPALVSLSVICNNLSPGIVIQPLSLRHPPSLRRLSLAAYYNARLGLEGLKAMSCFTTVESLTLSLAFADIPQTDLPSRIELNSLVSLRLSSSTRDVGIKPVYDIIASPNLRELHIGNAHCAGDAAFRRMSAAWARSFPSLEVLDCWVAFADVEPPPEPCSSLSSLLRPLSGLRRMREVTVFLCCVPIVLDDNDLLAFAQAWPSLEKLHLGSTETYSSSLGISLLGLLSLSTYCPNLSSLKLHHLVLRPEDIAQLPLERSCPPHGLRMLEVKSGLSPEMYEVVRDRVFPNLHRFIAPQELYDR